LSWEELPLKRNPYRMPLIWVPLALGFMAVGVQLGWSWWAALLVGLIPGAWSWLPGPYNTFAVWRALGKRVHTAFTEMIQGALGALVSCVILGAG
jgi:hypothetical protein